MQVKYLFFRQADIFWWKGEPIFEVEIFYDRERLCKIEIT